MYVVKHSFLALYFAVPDEINTFVLCDLRLTKVGVQRNSFFYAHFRVVFPFVFVREKNALAFHPKRTCV